MAMKPNTKAVIEYLQGQNGADLTSADVAEALGLEKRQVDGIFTSAIQRKQLGFREEAEVEKVAVMGGTAAMADETVKAVFK